MKRYLLYAISICLMVAGLAIVVASSADAASIGTQAGTIITNSVSVDYQINNVPQGSKTGSTSFVVDRMIDLVVTDKADVYTGPSSTMSTLVYLVTNNSNTTIRVALSTQLSSTRQYDPGSVTIWTC